MKIIKGYFPELRPRSGRRLDQAELLQFERQTGLEVMRMPNGAMLPQLKAMPRFVESSPEELAYLNALRQFDFAVPTATRTGQYDEQDFASSEVLAVSIPFSRFRIHKDQHPGTLMYREDPPVFRGTESLLYSGYSVSQRMRVPFLSEPIGVDLKRLQGRDWVLAEERPSAFVSDEVRSIWEAMRVTGCLYWETAQFNSRKSGFVPYWGQVITKGISDYVSYCESLENGEPLFRLRYSDVADLPDIFIMDRPGESANMYIFVRQKVYQCTKYLSELKWYPIELVG